MLEGVLLLCGAACGLYEGLRVLGCGWVWVLWWLVRSGICLFGLRVGSGRWFTLLWVWVLGCDFAVVFAGMRFPV